VANSGADSGDPASRFAPKRKWMMSIRLDFPAAFLLPVALAFAVRRTETMFKPGLKRSRLNVGRDGLQISWITRSTSE
jgi:hypothetical protein